jgi:hypothetical protein
MSHYDSMRQKLRDFIFRELVFVADPENFGERQDLLDLKRVLV